MKHDLRYGGSSCDHEEYDAIIQSVRESIETGNWQAGKQAALLEQEAADFLGVKYGILTTSGSCAGLLALSALELPN
jgi:dTDP-4-amino-4,6-dideoxygalactose transaminase